MCCQNLSGCSSSLSAGAIVGIVIGCIVFTALTILAFICICRRNRKKPLVNPFLFISNSSSSTTQANTSKEYTNSNRNIDEPIAVVTPLETTSDKSDLNTMIPSTATQTPSNDDFYVVVHPYPPQMPDELELNSGDIICLALNFDDGWALGFNVTTGLKGAFPLVCISPAPEDCLDQLLNMPTITTDDLSISQQQNNIQRSLSHNSYNSIHHSNTNTNTNTTNNTTPNNNINHIDTIPKRSVNYKQSYDYIEAESPSSPTLHTPFFDSPSPPPPTLTPQSLPPEIQNKSPPL
jgi:hypothetical protein